MLHTPILVSVVSLSLVVFVNMMELHLVLVGAVDVLKRRKGESIPRFIFVPEWRTADDVVRCRSHPSNIGFKKNQVIVPIW